MGVEFAGKGANVQLGPGVNVARVPNGGRNFEYISGEDPYLGSVMLPAAVQGIQSQGVIANMKHYINNNQETNRHNVSANVDERTHMEMYATPFGAAANDVLSVMCSYNRINLTWACENPTTLNEELKDFYNFSGWVMSDWGATHSISIEAGLDQQMPDDSFFGAPLLQAVQSGNISEDTVDQSVLRILTAMFAAGLFDNPNTGTRAANVTSSDHNQLARSLASQSSVLLQNLGILPLNKSSTQQIAVLGLSAHDLVITGGQGSGAVVPAYHISPLQGIVNKLTGASLPESTVFANRLGLKRDQTISHLIQSEHVALPGLPPNVVYNNGLNISLASEIAASADIAIVVVADDSTEGIDRPNLHFPFNEDDLVVAVSSAQPNTIVVCINPSAVITSWSHQVQAILAMFMPGQEEGNAMADILFGDADAGGRLPITFPNVENEVGFSLAQYPGLPVLDPLNAEYSEKLQIGYRWYQSHNVQPRFPFGHGLSYTVFSYSNLQIDGRVVSFNLTNIGDRVGYEVSQLYVAFPPTAGEPPLQLKGFQKVQLAPGQSTTIVFDLQDRDLSIWDVTTHSFVPQSGHYGINIGASSADLRLFGTLVN
jgi:beta-glucosidase